MGKEAFGAGDVLSYESPIFVVGDSHARLFSNCLFRAGAGEYRFTVAKQIHMLNCANIVLAGEGSQRAVHPLFLNALRTESLIAMRDGVPVAVHRLPLQERAAVVQSASDPVMIFMLGETDVRTLNATLDGWSGDAIEKVVDERVAPLFSVLTYLRSLGFERMYLHSIAPESPPRERQGDLAWAPGELPLKLRMLFHERFRAFALTNALGFIDTWDDVSEGGGAKSEFYADGIHLNSRANVFTLRRLARAQGLPDSLELVGRCRPIYAVGGAGILPFANSVIVGASGTRYATRALSIENFNEATAAEPDVREHFFHALYSDSAYVVNAAHQMEPEPFKELRSGDYHPPVLIDCGRGVNSGEGQPSPPLMDLLRIASEGGFGRFHLLDGFGSGPPAHVRALALARLRDVVTQAETALGSDAFPYDGRPERARWQRAVSALDANAIDPQGPAKFKFDRSSAIASAGSCFARHISSNLQQRGYRYLVTEPGSDYSACFGNIYSAVQLQQLFARAYGTFSASDSVWSLGDNFVDAFRPRHRPLGYASFSALEGERVEHLAAVRRMFEELDVFVFTLGLTEAWCARADGAVYPVCPGQDFGRFSNERYVFKNFGVAENVGALREFLAGLSSVNPGARVILTVSPVPLAATMENSHVVRASLYSKAVLRVAAEEICRTHENVDYFASYEIITMSCNANRYFEPDRRHVNAFGVAHVMRSLFENFTVEQPTPVDAPSSQEPFDPCDEDVLAQLLERDFQ